MATRKQGWAFALVGALVAALAAYYFWPSSSGDPHAAVVDGSVRGWKTIEYQDVRVDIPADWERRDLSDCEFQYERWAGPRAKPCEFTEGLSFYGSALFDPFQGPGVSRTIENGQPVFAGYVYAGPFAVYASGSDRAEVQRMLDSARPSKITVSTNARERLPVGSSGHYTFSLHCDLATQITIDGRSWEPAWRADPELGLSGSGVPIDRILKQLRVGPDGQNLRGTLVRRSVESAVFRSPDLPDGLVLDFRPTSRQRPGCA
ncbi:MAG: hypothetical protein ACJ72O_01060 [Marmoricola sp.]